MSDCRDWADRLEAAMARTRLIDRVAVVAQTASTQDAARRLCAGRAGLVLLAGRQTSGRGRRGGAWADTGQTGLAATFVLDAQEHGSGRVSAGAGLAACAACEAALAGLPAPAGLKWPNDVVDGPTGRKLAGVLVERFDRLLFVGIGVNVLRPAAGWGDLAAVSLAELGSAWTRGDAAERLMLELDGALALDAAELARRWRQRDVLIGGIRTFVHDGRALTGRVLEIDPEHAIVLQTARGRVRLPASATSLAGAARGASGESR